MTDKIPYQAMSEALSEMAETVTMTDAVFRKILAKEVAKARKGGLSDDDISLALAGAMASVIF